MLSHFRGRVIEYLVLANAFMFIVRLAADRWVMHYMALTPAYITQMPWTVITSMFIHADFFHILFNMLFGVMMFGSYLERIIGEREFTKVYFIGGLAASAFYVFMSLALHMPSPYIAAIGASGAVYAIIGTMVVLRPHMSIYIYFLFPMPLYIFAGLYLLYGLIAMPTGMAGNTAVTAHVGGLLAGLMMGRAYKVQYRPPEYEYVRYY
jgi:membrane associated rhomboid family serine protease